MNKREISDNTAGSLSAELVVLAPILLAIIFLFVFALRVERTSILIKSESRNAAQLASVAGSPTNASVLVSEHVNSELAQQGVYCSNGAQISINFSNYKPGGYVSVSVTCNVSLSDLGIPISGGTVTETSTSTAPIDPYVTVTG
jgi:hypothetical protein